MSSCNCIILNANNLEMIANAGYFINRFHHQNLKSLIFQSQGMAHSRWTLLGYAILLITKHGIKISEHCLDRDGRAAAALALVCRQGAARPAPA